MVKPNAISEIFAPSKKVAETGGFEPISGEFSINFVPTTSTLNFIIIIAASYFMLHSFMPPCSVY